MSTLRIIATYFRIGLIGELEYRINFFIQVFESLLGLVVGLGGLAVVFQHTDELAGWLPDQLVALVGIHVMVGGFINLVISPSMEQFMQDVRKGTLDFTLTKPEDAQVLVTFKRFELWKLVEIILGLIVLGVALARLQAAIGWGETAVFLITLLCGLAIVYSFWLILATLSFWVTRVENILVIFQSMYRAGRWPIGIYPHWLRLALTFIVPIAFAVTLPAEGLTGRLTPAALAGAVVAALVILLAARLFWRHGLRHYSGASA